ncbi:right-handed parallel beta-helix repeat-containing protein, partial [Acidiluteibacter ferrifornacis]
MIDTLSYTTPIQPGDTASVSLSPITFNSTSVYDIKVYTSNPNGVVDPINVDDTLSLQGLRTGLSGTYTLDPNLAPSASNFTSFSSLSQQLSNYGICGPTTVNVAAGLYTNPLDLSNIVGLDAINTLTIDGVDSSATIVSVTTPDFAALTLSNVDYVTVKNMTFEYVGTAGSGVIVANANHNIVSNCIIHVDTTSTGSGIYAISVSGSSSSHTTGAIANYNTFSDNVIIGGYYGIRTYGSTTTPVIGTVISNNEFRKQYYYGIYCYYGDSTEVIGNDIDMIYRGNTNADGMYMYYTPNFKFNENKISALDYGAYIYDFSKLFVQTRKNEVVNNMIYSDNDYGLYMYYIDSTNIYHNTIVSNSSTIPALQIYSNTTISIANYDIRNNIIYSNGSFAVRTNIADSFMSIMDHNAYYTSGSNLFSMNSTTYTDLAAYFSANNLLNANSVEGDPGFVTYPTDLHVLSALVSNNGDNNVGVMIDIDGDVRPSAGATNVDIGADEFTPPSFELGLTALNSPNSGCGLSNAEPVVIEILNSGQQAASNFTVGFSVDGGNYVVETVSGPLAVAASLTYTFTATADLSVLGPHTIDVYVSIAGDNVPANDSIFRNIVNIPVISGFPYTESFETSAGGWTVDGGTSSFALGTPTGSVINSASNGTQAWVTNLSGNYLADEAGYVKSPCLDFSTLIAPIISMDVWWNSEFSWDGAVLQSSIDGGTTWQKVGSFGDPNNWYNDNSINGLNAGTTILEPSGEGWTGRTSSSNGSNGWVNATHQLTGLGGQPGVIFRVAFGSDGSVMDEGFAFDNVQIYESPAVDIKAIEVSRPLVGCGLSATETIAARYENLGTDTLTNFPVAYSVNGVAITPETFTDTLFPGDKKSYEFTTTANLANTIQYTIEVWSAAVGDAITSNDTASVTFTNIAASTNPYPQTFDVLTDGATDFSPINWTPINAGAFDWRAET